MKAIVKKISCESGQPGCAVFNFIIAREDGTELLRSTRYKSKDSAYKGVRAVKKNCSNDNRYAIRKTPDGRHSFKIKAANGVAVVDSIDFSSEQEMLESVKLLKNSIPDCEIEFYKISK